MIRLLVNGYSYQQKVILRNALVEAYRDVKDSQPYIGNADTSRDYMAVTRDIANAVSWLEDELAKE